jgi:hypothetical protein
MKVSELIERLRALPADLPVEIEACEPECLGGGAVGSVWIEDGDDGRAVASVSRVNDPATR